jgi:2-polyprenyl-3-methyl-5-hydroxy-6-metoxy-1,4-benzoquinol methylase
LPLVPWVSDGCDADIAAVLVAHAGAAGGSLLDVGCGLGQIARHALTLGYRVTATDVSVAALQLAAATESRISWLRDDVCASALVGGHDVIVDRATLHTLPRSRVHAWAASMRRLLAPGGVLVVKAHRDGIANVTTGWRGEAIAALVPELELISTHDSELPGITTPEPIPATLAVLRRPPVSQS